jgi:hypothetical protein
MTTSNTYGRQVVVPLTNKSGGGVIAGDVVVIDTTNNASFTTTTSAGATLTIGVAQETIGANAVGRILTAGYAALVNVNASVTRGNYGKTHTVAKQATDAGAARVAGTCCQFLTGGTTPDAIVYPVDLAGTALTNPMSAVGDMIQGTTAGAPARLAAVATGTVLASQGVTTTVAWGYPPFHGVRAYHNTTQTVGASAAILAALNSERFDTDAYHDTSSNNSRLTVPTGLGGYYLIGYTVDCASTADIGDMLAEVYLNGTTIISVEQRRGAAGITIDLCGSTIYNLAQTDYVELRLVSATTGNTRTINSGGNYSPEFWMTLIGV